MKPKPISTDAAGNLLKGHHRIKATSMKKPKLKPLIPPDTKRCQAEARPGGPYSFMTLGPIPPPERCKNRPSFIATERKPAKDGRRGSMSLCGSCFAAMIEQEGPMFCTYRKIK